MFKLFLDDWSEKEFISRPIPEAEEFATIKKESDWFYGIDNAISDFLADRAPDSWFTAGGKKYFIFL